MWKWPLAAATAHLSAPTSLTVHSVHHTNSCTALPAVMLQEVHDLYTEPAHVISDAATGDGILPADQNSAR